jgi:hypothetical protein
MIARKKMCDVCDFLALSVKERIAVADLRSEIHVDVCISFVSHFAVVSGAVQ